MSKRKRAVIWVAALIMIISLFIMAVRYRRGEYIPIWVKSLVAKEN